MANSSSFSSTASVPHCGECGIRFERGQLESHICVDHLDYFPYGCMHCGRWLPTVELAEFHAEKNGHLPVKIKENFDLAKEQRLKTLLQQRRQSQSASGSSGNSRRDSLVPTSGKGNEIFVMDDARDDKSSVTSTPGVRKAGSSSSLFETIRCTNRGSVHPSNSPSPPPITSGIACSSSPSPIDSLLSSICTPSGRIPSSREEGRRKVPSANQWLQAFADDRMMAVSSNATLTKHRKLSWPTSFKSRLSSSMTARSRGGHFSAMGGKKRVVLPIKPGTNHGWKRQDLHCRECDVTVAKGVVAAHIFTVHLKDRKAIFCPYCPFTVAYWVSHMKSHITVRHPGSAVHVIDRRFELQKDYYELREKCFPDVYTQRKRLKPVSSNEQQESFLQMDDPLGGESEEGDALDENGGNDDGSRVEEATTE